MVMQSPDREKRSHQAMAPFATNTSSVLYEEKHRAIGGYLSEYRQGRIVHHPLPTLSIGAIWVDPGMFRSHHEISGAATAAKKMANTQYG